MKKQTNKLMLLTASVILFSLINFNSKSACAQNWSSWSQFKMSDCYKGISYRFRERSTSTDKNQVQVEIKNSYTKGISIAFRITNNPEDKAIYRTDIASGDSYVTEQYVDKGVPFHIIHHKMRFEGDKYGDPYRPCDR